MRLKDADFSHKMWILCFPALTSSSFDWLPPSEDTTDLIRVPVNTASRSVCQHNGRRTGLKDWLTCSQKSALFIFSRSRVRNRNLSFKLASFLPITHALCHFNIALPTFASLVYGVYKDVIDKQFAVSCFGKVYHRHSGDGSILFKTHELCFTCINIEANASCCLLLAMQQGFGLGWFIC